MDDDLETGPSNRPSKKNGFARFNFFSQLFLNVLVNKLRSPTPVQRKVIPLAMEGKDVVACYKTGSGKTLAYLLPILNKLRSHSLIVGARALILLPTRDLADQITRVLKSFLRNLDITYTLVLGGHTFEGQFQSLAANPDIIVATPGRLLQLLQQTDLQLSRVQTIVFDEADKLFGDKNFQKQVKEIISKCPSSQRLLFSATITPDLQSFATAGLHQYSYVHQQIALPQTMKIDFFLVRPQQKVSALLLLLQTVVQQSKVIVFVSTRFHVDYLHQVLSSSRECYGVYGKMDMQQRTEALNGFRYCSKGVLVVTDVAARGLDIPLLGFVLHYDYPASHSIFVHRSGRTARAGAAGHTLALITHHEISYLTELAAYLAKPIDCRPPVQDHNDTIHFGTIPMQCLVPYVEIVEGINQKDEEVGKFREVADRAFEKFKKCRAETSLLSRKRAKGLNIQCHRFFRGGIQVEEETFLQRVHDFTPKKSFLELQRIAMNKQPENDAFLAAIEKIKKVQNNKEIQVKKREKLREKRSERWREILDKNQIRQYEEYQENRPRLPINLIEGVTIEMTDSTRKKSLKTDFRNHSQYITIEKDPNVRTEFDQLPRIKMTEVDSNLMDEKMIKRTKKRVWSKEKKNFMWQKDVEDKMSKEKVGQKAYEKWKKQSKQSLPKVGEHQDAQNTQKAKNSWQRRRQFRHGWKDTTDKGRVRDLKNNKTKAVQKRLKTRLISKAARKNNRR